MSYRKYIIAFIFLYVSCTSDTMDETSSAIYDVDPIFEPYVQAFVAEAANRGIDIDYRQTGLTIYLSDVAQTDASGRCFTADNTIEINKASWVDGFDNFKTRLIFHELGHCTLKRGHRNERFDNGLWKSNMRGSPLSDAELRIPIPYYGFRIPYYNDEMFDTSTPDPEWASASFDFSEIQDDSKMLVHTASSISRYLYQVQEDLSEYEIDVNFEFNELVSQTTTLKWGNNSQSYSIVMYPEGTLLIFVEEGVALQALYRDRFGAFVDEKPLNQITIRRHDGLEKIFMNGKFIFHIDQLGGGLQSIKFESLMNGNNQFDDNFNIHSVNLSRIEL